MTHRISKGPHTKEAGSAVTHPSLSCPTYALPHSTRIAPRLQPPPSAGISLITAMAKRRLADEYDAAQDRREVRTRAGSQAVSQAEKAGFADIGLKPKEIHEARQIRNTERASTGRPELQVEPPRAATSHGSHLREVGVEGCACIAGASILIGRSSRRPRPSPSGLWDDLRDSQLIALSRMANLHGLQGDALAEEVGFEPTESLHPRRFSRPVP